MFERTLDNAPIIPIYPGAVTGPRNQRRLAGRFLPEMSAQKGSR